MIHLSVPLKAPRPRIRTVVCFRKERWSSSSEIDILGPLPRKISQTTKLWITVYWSISRPTITIDLLQSTIYQSFAREQDLLSEWTVSEDELAAVFDSKNYPYNIELFQD